MKKQAIRQRILDKRRKLGHKEWSDSSILAQRNLLLLDQFLVANCIALYSPVHNETDTSIIFESSLSLGKQVLYPAIIGQEIVFRQIYYANQLVKGTWNIPEPIDMGSDYVADKANLIIVPGVAFDLSGNRIGYGKGFYDRFLKNVSPNTHLAGLCHDFQIIEEGILADSHDIKIEIVVSDKRIIYTKK